MHSQIQKGDNQQLIHKDQSLAGNSGDTNILSYKQSKLGIGQDLLQSQSADGAKRIGQLETQGTNGQPPNSDLASQAQEGNESIKQKPKRKEKNNEEKKKGRAKTKIDPTQNLEAQKPIEQSQVPQIPSQMDSNLMVAAPSILSQILSQSVDEGKNEPLNGSDMPNAKPKKPRNNSKKDKKAKEGEGNLNDIQGGAKLNPEIEMKISSGPIHNVPQQMQNQYEEEKGPSQYNQQDLAQGEDKSMIEMNLQVVGAQSTSDQKKKKTSKQKEKPAASQAKAEKPDDFSKRFEKCMAMMRDLKKQQQIQSQNEQYIETRYEYSLSNSICSTASSKAAKAQGDVAYHTYVMQLRGQELQEQVKEWANEDPVFVQKIKVDKNLLRKADNFSQILRKRFTKETSITPESRITADQSLKLQPQEETSQNQMQYQQLHKQYLAFEQMKAVKVKDQNQIDANTVQPQELMQKLEAVSSKQEAQMRMAQVQPQISQAQNRNTISFSVPQDKQNSKKRQKTSKQASAQPQIEEEKKAVDGSHASDSVSKMSSVDVPMGELLNKRAAKDAAKKLAQEKKASPDKKAADGKKQSVKGSQMNLEDKIKVNQKSLIHEEQERAAALINESNVSENSEQIGYSAKQIIQDDKAITQLKKQEFQQIVPQISSNGQAIGIDITNLISKSEERDKSQSIQPVPPIVNEQQIPKIAEQMLTQNQQLPSLSAHNSSDQARQQQINSTQQKYAQMQQSIAQDRMLPQPTSSTYNQSTTDQQLQQQQAIINQQQMAIQSLYQIQQQIHIHARNPPMLLKQQQKYEEISKHLQLSSGSGSVGLSKEQQQQILQQQMLMHQQQQLQHQQQQALRQQFQQQQHGSSLSNQASTQAQPSNNQFQVPHPPFQMQNQQQQLTQQQQLQLQQAQQFQTLSQAQQIMHQQFQNGQGNPHSNNLTGNSMTNAGFTGYFNKYQDQQQIKNEQNGSTMPQNGNGYKASTQPYTQGAQHNLQAQNNQQATNSQQNQGLRIQSQQSEKNSNVQRSTSLSTKPQKEQITQKQSTQNANKSQKNKLQSGKPTPKRIMSDQGDILGSLQNSQDNLSFNSVSNDSSSDNITNSNQNQISISNSNIGKTSNSAVQQQDGLSESVRSIPYQTYATGSNNVKQLNQQLKPQKSFSNDPQSLHAKQNNEELKAPKNPAERMHQSQNQLSVGESAHYQQMRQNMLNGMHQESMQQNAGHQQQQMHMPYVSQHSGTSLNKVSAPNQQNQNQVSHVSSTNNIQPSQEMANQSQISKSQPQTLLQLSQSQSGQQQSSHQYYNHQYQQQQQQQNFSQQHQPNEYQAMKQHQSSNLDTPGRNFFANPLGSSNTLQGSGHLGLDFRSMNAPGMNSNLGHSQSLTHYGLGQSHSNGGMQGAGTGMMPIPSLSGGNLNSPYMHFNKYSSRENIFQLNNSNQSQQPSSPYLGQELAMKNNDFLSGTDLNELNRNDMFDLL